MRRLGMEQIEDRSNFKTCPPKRKFNDEYEIAAFWSTQLPSRKKQSSEKEKDHLKFIFVSVVAICI
jgi:hypothetical protein